MRAFKVSKDSNLSLEEKIKLLDSYDMDDLNGILKEFEARSRDYEKEVIIAVINKLFENGVTSI